LLNIMYSLQRFG